MVQSMSVPLAVTCLYK